MSTIQINGVIRGIGKYYVSGLEILEIHIKCQDAHGLKLVSGQRRRCSLEIRGDTYQAGLRATERNPYAWICPDLMDSRGGRMTLAEVLGNHGFVKNQRVTLNVVRM